MAKLTHTPGEPFVDLDPDAPGGAIVKTREGATVHVVARCAAYDAALLMLAFRSPHDCDLAGCPGPENLRRLARLTDVVARARDVVSAFSISYPDLVAALGETKAQALWAALTALDQSSAPAQPGPGLASDRAVS